MEHRAASPVLRSAPFLAALTFALIVTADQLFYRQRLGWTLGLYLALLVIALGLPYAGRLRRTHAATLAVALLGLAGALVWQPGPLIFLLAIPGLVALAYTLRSGWTPAVTRWIERLVLFLPRLVRQPIRDLRLSGRAARRTTITMDGVEGPAAPRRRGLASGSLRAIVAWALPLLLGLLFVALFSLANPIIGNWVHLVTTTLQEALARWVDLFNPLRWLLWTVIGVAVWALLRTRDRRRLERIAARVPAVRLPLVRWSAVGLVVRCLLVFNVIFAIQNLLDGYYLYGGAELPEGMTYAQYAHRGAYPLVATALLAAAFVLFTFRSGGAAEKSPVARRLVYLWIAQNIILLLSAAWRLRLYVDVYSLTMWRVAAAIWMLLVALGLLWIVWRIVRGRSNAWLLRVNVVTALAVLYICCFINFAGLIAEFNVSRCREVGGPGVSIDLRYLESLGPSALPALGWLQANAHDEATIRRAGEIEAFLQNRLQHQLRNWRGWTLHRAALAAATTTDTDSAP